ncbi:TIGR03792 family protein [Capilliphycus salinus ALCB114379]|uniref:TIGR03792 family protein n=1 Tax=Capilliphycus salinus TaxID=2768948 RepID=UPI0039A66E42
MVIEWLQLKVPREKWEAFLKRDEEVWTQGLKRYPGFIGKETWIDPQKEEIVLVIRWETREQWKSIPLEDLEALDRQMGDLQMPIVNSYEYQVRKFLH